MFSLILLPFALSVPPTFTFPQLPTVQSNAGNQQQVDQEAFLFPQPAGSGLTILETAASTGRFDTLAAAIELAGLTSTLEGPGPFTVFAPTDAAFAKVPPHRLEFLLRPENQAFLSTLLTFHVAGESLNAAAVLGSPYISTVSGQRAEVDAANLQIEGADFIVTDVFCNNGVIHIIDEVIFPELRTITAMTTTIPDFSTLNLALGIAGLDDDLETAGPFTVFAPTNAAFDALPPGVLDSLVADPNALGNVLLFHVTSGRLYAEDVLASGQLTMLNNLVTDVTLDNGVAKINDSVITVTDVETWNGVIHVIDAVLVPGP